jgi:hypothetical protein
MHGKRRHNVIIVLMVFDLLLVVCNVNGMSADGNPVNDLRCMGIGKGDTRAIRGMRSGITAARQGGRVVHICVHRISRA